MSLRTARDSTIDTLCRHYASDDLSMPELERRLERARGARSQDELDALLADLSGPRGAPPAPAGPEAVQGGAENREAEAPQPVAVAQDKPRRTASRVALAVMGGTVRSGRWEAPPGLVAIAVMGGLDLDFREAVLGPGVTEVNCFAFWGGIDISVPPGVHVEVNGFALMGGFEQGADLESRPEDDAPTLRINGLAIMGGVDVRVRERGSGPRPGGGPEQWIHRKGTRCI